MLADKALKRSYLVQVAIGILMKKLRGDMKSSGLGQAYYEDKNSIL